MRAAHIAAPPMFDSVADKISAGVVWSEIAEVVAETDVLCIVQHSLSLEKVSLSTNSQNKHDRFLMET
jgi:hypothetical protein